MPSAVIDRLPMLRRDRLVSLADVTEWARPANDHTRDELTVERRDCPENETSCLGSFWHLRQPALDRTDACQALSSSVVEGVSAFPLAALLVPADQAAQRLLMRPAGSTDGS